MVKLTNFVVHAFDGDFGGTNMAVHEILFLTTVNGITHLRSLGHESRFPNFQ